MNNVKLLHQQSAVCSTHQRISEKAMESEGGLENTEGDGEGQERFS